MDAQSGFFRRRAFGWIADTYSYSVNRSYGYGDLSDTVRVEAAVILKANGDISQVRDVRRGLETIHESLEGKISNSMDPITLNDLGYFPEITSCLARFMFRNNLYIPQQASQVPTE